MAHENILMTEFQVQCTTHAVAWHSFTSHE